MTTFQNWRDSYSETQIIFHAFAFKHSGITFQALFRKFDNSF